MPSSVKLDAHTYDKGYKKWETFDVDAALREVDEDASPKSYETPVTDPTPQPQPVKKIISKPKSAVLNTGKNREDMEREDGNAHYKQGDYVAAIKSYTRCLGFNSHNAVVLSNRAMAYLKNREYSSAEDDCTLALKVDPNHIKSFSRRGTARNALGKHRLALIDFEQALRLDPNNKQTLSQITSTKELMKAAIKRAPKRSDFEIEVLVKQTTKEEKPTTQEPVNLVKEKENVLHTVDNMNPSLESMETGKTSEPNNNEVSTKGANPTHNSRVQRPVSTNAFPKIPKKAPTTSYEFLRMWKSLTMRGDAERQQQFQHLRASYLRLINPLLLPSIFKNSIDSDILCDILSVFLSDEFQVIGSDHAFVLAFVRNLSCVPRFKMTAMFFSKVEKDICASVFDQLLEGTSDEQMKLEIHALEEEYGVSP